MTNEINLLLNALRESSRTIALTGAGVSTDCGIPDYRSQGGLWDRYKPVTFQEFLSCPDAREEYWRRKKETWPAMRDAQPGPAHRALKKLEDLDLLQGIITQNIDGLHTRAGNRQILEIHGTNLETLCLDCKQLFPFEDAFQKLSAGETVPLCSQCGGLLKPNTISFGQALDTEILHRSVDWVQQASLVLCIGSSLVVDPAASLPRYARRNGAKIIILNREATPLDHQADFIIHTEIGPFFTRLLETLS